MGIDQNDAVAEALQRLVSDSFASRLWRRDASLWPEPSPGGDPADKTLGWLDLPMRLSALGQQFADLNSQLVADGFTDVVVLGMGGSSMTPLTLSSVFGEKTNTGSTIRLHALDTVNPTTVSAITESLDLGKTLFFVSSKSGTTIEPLTLESHFRAAMANSPESSFNRKNFVALTDPGTPLSERARAGEFGTWVSTPDDVGGRFSALCAFGMMPAAATGINIRLFAESAARMAQSCSVDSADNPGTALGAFMATNALAGRNKVTLITSDEYSLFGAWVDQLLAESTGKNGKGLVPVTGEPIMTLEDFGPDRQFVVFKTGKDMDRLDHAIFALRSAEIPVFVIEPSSKDKHEIAGEFFRWQFATAAASSLMDIYPFDQPDVESAKVKSRELLSDVSININAIDLTDALNETVQHTAPNYVAITAFLPESPELTAAFSNLRKAISEKTGMSTTFGYGPRYLHSTGQLYKGGPQNAIVLGFVSGKYDHLAVPGESYTFGQLTKAQAGGDFMVMAEGGQKVLPIELGDDPTAELTTATQQFIE
ncbi:MAG: glucose-6-phosphate isomerase [Chloroflexi bacterium]|jgi:glucose-6-phosphate isomerase|nr:glucose-6-phosphate isomerase [Chloroflexota bacterium]MBT5627340.1 glucose-6-phosphate isomerase [Chloroflexota bacterium]